MSIDAHLMTHEDETREETHGEAMVDPLLNDIRILKLAEMYERAYEGFVLEMADKYVRDDEVKRRLHRLVAPTDRHGERIGVELQRLNALASEADQTAIERAAIRDVLEVERAARAFYLRFVEDLQDARCADLFRKLAREERAHVRIAEDALALSGKHTGRILIDDEMRRMLRLIEDTPSWEGTSDLSDVSVSKV